MWTKYVGDDMEACVNVLCEPASFTESGEGAHVAWKDMVDVRGMYLSAGTHPHNARLYDDTVERNMLQVLAHPRTIALGEIGLDYHYDSSPRDVQKTVLERQIGLALTLNKPLVIHSREAESDTYEILTRLVPRGWKIHIHCFTDTPAFAASLLEFFPNLFIGITGVVTFGTALNTQEVVRATPLERLLLETDSPYMVPRVLQTTDKTRPSTTICHPGMIPLVAQKVADLKGLTYAEVMRTCRENARRMYGI
ncbi:hypothetical protein BJ742DRAFT_674149 [Cladochytrium replicatum]|nr:hypothetical protein BJ742DRAFT_674149 [Cladochytrium replicatum]